MGGATSVKECGLYEALSNGDYQFYDRDKVSTQEEKQEIALRHLHRIISLEVSMR